MGQPLLPLRQHLKSIHDSVRSTTRRANHRKFEASFEIPPLACDHEGYHMSGASSATIGIAWNVLAPASGRRRYASGAELAHTRSKLSR